MRAAADPRPSAVPGSAVDGGAEGSPRAYAHDQWRRLAERCLRGRQTIILESSFLQNSVMPAFIDGAHSRTVDQVFTQVVRQAASAAAPSAAAAFLLSRAGEFAGSPEEQTTLLIRATQEIAFRSAAYETSALLLGVLAGLGSGTHEIEVGLPAFASSRLQRHLPQSRLEELITDTSNVDLGAAFVLAVTTLTELAAQTSSPLSPRKWLQIPRLPTEPGAC